MSVTPALWGWGWALCEVSRLNILSNRSGLESPLDRWITGAKESCSNLNPRPVLEIVITVPAPATPALPAAPRRAPATASNHQQSPPSHSSTTTTATTATTSHKQKMYWKPWPSFFILPRNGMKFSTLLHAIQKKSEKDTTRPVKNYMDCNAVFRTSSRYWEIGRDRARKKYFLDLFVQEQWGPLIINIGIV